MQSAAQLQTPNAASVEAFEMMTPEVETTDADNLLQTEDMRAAQVISGRSLCDCLATVVG